MEQEDYSKIYEYESMGKEYAGEKACISLTSWKARINIVSKTLYSLIKMCPGFHIVLVLSKDEFPLMEQELPDNLMLFVESKLIELFWIRPNLKSFKKILFTMDKYRDVPVISADDDCIYTCNYAQELYDNYIEYKMTCSRSPSFGTGIGVIFKPNLFDNFRKYLTKEIIETNHDDLFYRFLLKNKNEKYISIYKTRNESIKIIDFISKNGISTNINEKLNKEKMAKVFHIQVFNLESLLYNR